MRINTYTKREDLSETLRKIELSLEALNSIKDKGFKTINDAFLSVVKNQLTIRELDKFSKLFGERAIIKKDSWSWDMYSKNTLSYRYINLYIDNLKIGQFTIDRFNKIERHYVGNSYNLEEHTIQNLIKANEEYLQRLKHQLDFEAEIDRRIKDYEKYIETKVNEAYQLYIKDIEDLVYSRSI